MYTTHGVLQCTQGKGFMKTIVQACTRKAKGYMHAIVQACVN